VAMYGDGLWSCPGKNPLGVVQYAMYGGGYWGARHLWHGSGGWAARYWVSGHHIFGTGWWTGWGDGFWEVAVKQIYS